MSMTRSGSGPFSPSRGLVLDVPGQLRDGKRHQQRDVRCIAQRAVLDDGGPLQEILEEMLAILRHVEYVSQAIPDAVDANGGGAAQSANGLGVAL